MRSTLLATIAALALAPALEAQERRANTPPPPAPAPAPAAKPRVGYAATPAPPPQAAPVHVVQPVYYYSPDGYAVNGSPYLAMSDGSVLVNFGYGYERVLRACAPRHNATPSDPWAKDALGRIPAPPGIAAIAAGTRGQAVGNAPARNAQACYRNENGRVNVVAH